MLVGILSDTHDRLAALNAGLRALREHGAEYFVHCGDLGSPRMLDPFAGTPAAFVFGNNDWDREGLERYAGDLGIQCLGSSGELTLAGKKFAVTHGDHAEFIRRVVAEQRHDYLLQGHTHSHADVRAGSVRIINPGALYRAHEKTVAVLDTATDRLEFLVVEI